MREANMRFIADFHIHSHYSRATSKDMNVVALTKWGQLKGIHVMGTGDFTHPKWFEEMRQKLEPAESGLFRLKSEYEEDIQKEIPKICRKPMRFMLTVEVSTIYKKNDKVRKVHSLVVVPSFEVAAKVNAALAKIGTITADGRPILGLDTKKLLHIALDASEDCIFIPAHIWTPHFSVFGSASGFDSLEECFEELAPYIFAVETGLSSDPPMNWRIKELDSRALVSNSDAHSAEKLGREANVFNTELSYYAMRDALKTNDPKKLEATIEFYPEEGKYHLDGHRDCKTRLEPKETKRRNGLCPACGKNVTIGVLHRVEKLANRDRGYKPENRPLYFNIIPLAEVVSEVEGVGVKSKKVTAAYFNLLHNLGNEFYILLHAPLADIEKIGGHMVREAIDRMRKGNVHIAAGYDGEYGKVKIFELEERKKLAAKQQESLF